MAEYYAVLSRAVSGLKSNAPETRRAVYDKARNALIGQLKAIDPPLPTSEISRQRLELEEAIRRVERESSAAAAAPAATPARPAAPQQPVAGAAPPPPPAPSRGPASAAARVASSEAPLAAKERRSPQDVFRRAIQDSDKARGTEPRVAPPVPPAPAASVAAPVRAEPAAPEPPVHEPLADSFDDATLPIRQTRVAEPTASFEQAAAERDEPRLTHDYDDDDLWDRPEPAAEPVLAAAPRLDADDRALRGRRSRRDEEDDIAMDDMADMARPSRLPAIILTVLILALIGGAGAVAYSQRAFLTSFVGDIVAGLDADTVAPAPAAPPPAQVAENGSGKDTDRLLDDGGAPAAPAASGDVRVVTPTADGEPAVDAPEAAEAPAAPPPASVADAGPLVAQRAILYEEPLEGATTGITTVNAAVTWRFEPNGSNGAQVVGNVDVPERGMKLAITLRPNNDDTLPASHILEVVSTLPADFPGKGIREIPRIVLKDAEEARGAPLIGAPTGAQGIYWIVLSGAESDLRANLALIRDNGWFDLPIVYESGQRAILTFEKGTSGARAFESALAAWSSEG